MSLRVWLPLTKDLRNQGLDNVTVTNNGATFDANGKLGGCYSFDGSTSSINTNINIPNFALDKTYSITCWVCPSETSGQKPIIGIGPDWSWTIFQQNTDLRFVQWDESGSRWGDPAISGVFSANTWVHIGVVWNQSVLLFYKNGEKIYEWTAPTSRTIKVSSDTVKIGGNIYAWGNNYFNGKLNDVHIYDHALSPLEVKQISQGLILHYPLNRNGWGQENLLPCGGTYIQSSPWSTTFNRVDGYSWVTNSAFEATPGKTYTISVECDGTLANYHGASASPSAKSWTFWLYICNTDTTKAWQSGAYDTPVNLTSVNNNYRKIGNTHVWTYTLSSTQKYISLRTNSYSNGTDNVTVKWWNMKIEEGDVFTPWCPNLSNKLYNTLGLNDNIQYDTSGYGNNGTKIGTFDYNSDTPKYNVSTSFNGSAKIERDSLMGEVYTLSCWAKTIKNKSTSQMMVVDSNSQIGIAFYNGTIIGVYGTTRSTGSKSTLSGSNYKENEWNHFVVVKTSNDGKRNIYCNGELLTPVSDDYWSSASNNFGIGARNTSTPCYFYGEISDVRAYVTALSADDVKSLYQNSAYIDNQGNIYGAVYEEV